LGFTSYLACTSFKCAAIVGIVRPNASEKIDPFPGRLSFFVTLCYFLRVLFGGNDKFRIFANEWAGYTIAHIENINAKKL